MPLRRLSAGAPTTILAVWALIAMTACGARDRLPDVVLITVDTLRADHLTPYGSARDTSPFLADLADECALFTDAVSQCGTTPQSLSSIMTGLYPYTDGVMTKNDAFDYLTRSQRTLAAVLSDQGYRTHAITASIQSSTATGLELGFQTFDGVQTRRRRRGFLRRDAAEITARALQWLRTEAPDDAPVFLWLHYMDPHHPYEAPASHRHHFRDEEPTAEGATRTYRFDELLSTAYPLSDGALARMILDYDREVRFTDDALRKLFDEAPRLRDDALVIVTADHGEALGTHGMISHNDLYDTILHVPLMIRPPGGADVAHRSSIPTMLTDLFPTVHDMLGVPLDAPVRGMSLVPWFDGEATAPERLRLAEYPQQRALFDGQLKLIERPHGLELFDRSKDPGELRNVAGRRSSRAMAILERGRALAEAPLGPGADAPSTDAGSRPEVTPEMLDELRELGYLGDR